MPWILLVLNGSFGTRALPRLLETKWRSLKGKEVGDILLEREVRLTTKADSHKGDAANLKERNRPWIVQDRTARLLYAEAADCVYGAASVCEKREERVALVERAAELDEYAGNYSKAIQRFGEAKELSRKSGFSPCIPRQEASIKRLEALALAAID